MSRNGRVSAFLSKLKLHSPEHIAKRILSDWTLSKSIDKILELDEKIVQNKKEIDSLEITPFNFLPNSSMSSRARNCSELECRLKTIDTLARFSTLYSDRVFIPSYFDMYYHPFKNLNPAQERFIKTKLISDLIVLGRLVPLIDADIVVLFDRGFHYCPQHFERLLPTPYSQRLAKIATQIKTQNEHETRIAIVRVEDSGGDKTVYFEIHSKSDLFQHTEVISNFLSTLPSPIKKLASGLKVNKNLEEGIVLPPILVKQLGIISYTVNSVTSDLSHLQILSNSLDAKLITDSETEANILSKLSGNASIISQNDVIRKNLLLETPLLRRVSLDFLIKLRKTEWEAFVVYRNAINSVISQHLLNRKDLTSKDVKNIYDDIIYPRVAKLKSNLTIIKKKAKKDAKREILISGATLALGLLTGIPWLSAIGGVDSAHKIAKSIANSKAAPDEIKKDDYYFLFKLSEAHKN